MGSEVPPERTGWTRLSHLRSELRVGVRHPATLEMSTELGGVGSNPSHLDHLAGDFRTQLDHRIF